MAYTWSNKKFQMLRYNRISLDSALMYVNTYPTDTNIETHTTNNEEHITNQSETSRKLKVLYNQFVKVYQFINPNNDRTCSNALLSIIVNLLSK